MKKTVASKTLSQPPHVTGEYEFNSKHMEIKKFPHSKLPGFKSENEKENEIKKHEKILQKDLCPNLIFLQLFYSPSGYQLQHPAVLIEENEVGDRKIRSDNEFSKFRKCFY